MHTWLVPIAPTIVWDICKGSDIADGAIAQMRCANTRTVPPACFFFIVKSESVIFVRSVDQTSASHYAGRGRRPRRPICSGFAPSSPRRVILSEQRVASRTFGFANDNIVSKSKSENCQDNFRDLLGFIFNLLAQK